jgi:putative ABC transport system ATP-binding protein
MTVLSVPADMAELSRPPTLLRRPSPDGDESGEICLGAGALVLLERAERSYQVAPPGQPVHALRPVDLRVGVGDYLSVVGAAGSGKSTLLRLLGLVEPPSAGRALFCGADAARLPACQVAALRGRHVGFVFPGARLLPHRTVAQNAAMGLARPALGAESGGGGRDLLGWVGLAHRAAAYPAELPAGERRRVALARALAGRPSLLLCDEPAAGLDANSASLLLDLLDGLHGDGLAIVVATRDRAVAARASRRLKVAGGVTIELSAARARLAC